MRRIVNAIVKRLLWGICYLLPIKQNRLVISSFYGRGYGDNLKYVVNELIRRNVGIEIIWLVKDGKEVSSIPESVKTCKFNSFWSIFYLSTAEIWIDNCRKSFLYKKRKQFYIQTWHGGGAQKRCELDAVDKLSQSYLRMARKDAKNTDLMISESRFMTDLYHRSFWYHGPVYECGYPRYDILFHYDEHLISKVYDYFGIDRAKELVLYTPTFRVDHSFKAYDIDFKRLLTSLKTRFNKDYVILVHLHPNVANVEGGIDYDGINVINSTFYPDTQELIAVSSILIGDYSSINYDFSLKRMPVFRYTSDLEEFQNDRDLYFPFYEYPYPCARNNDELEELILNFDYEKYLNNLNAFFDKLGSVMQPGASEKIADIILDYIHSENKKDFLERNKNRFIY